jgi:hypothetical protein
VGVRQRDGRDESVLGGLKGGLKDGGPRKTAAAGGGVREGGESAGNAREKTPVKIEHAEKFLQRFDIRGWGKIENGLNVGGDGGKTSRGQMVTKKVKSRDTEETLDKIETETSVLKDLKDLTKVRQVIGKGVAEDQMVVQVREHERKFAEQTVHETLKGLGTVAEAKRHVEEFEEAKGSGNGSLWHVLGGHFDLMIAFFEINFRKETGPMKTCRKILYMRKRVTIGDSDKVETSIVTTRTERAIRLGDHVKGTTPGGVRTTDNP